MSKPLTDIDIETYWSTLYFLCLGTKNEFVLTAYKILKSELTRLRRENERLKEKLKKGDGWVNA